MICTLSGPKVPKQIFFYPELPKTGSGKVLKEIYENKSQIYDSDGEINEKPIKAKKLTKCVQLIR